MVEYKHKLSGCVAFKRAYQLQFHFRLCWTLICVSKKGFHQNINYLPKLIIKSLCLLVLAILHCTIFLTFKLCFCKTLQCWRKNSFLGLFNNMCRR